MAPVDLAEITFFELDRIFNESARAIQRKIRRKKRKNKLNNIEDKAATADGEVKARSPTRSRSPKRAKYSKVIPFGGFTSMVNNVNKTVVVSGVPPNADEKAMFILFSKCGSVSDINILENRRANRTGIAVVEFQEDEAVTRACMLGPPLNDMFGNILQVQRADAQLQKDKPAAPKKMMTRSQFTQQVLSGLKHSDNRTEGPNMRKLHIKNLRPVVTEEDMRGIFKPFGDFEDFKMGEQECWIAFQSHNDAQDAMGSMQGFQLVGQELQITVQSVEIIPPPPIVPPPPKETLEQQMEKDSDFGSTGGAAGRSGQMELMKKLAASQQGGPHGVAGVISSTGPVVMPPPPPVSGVPPPPPPPGGATAQALPPTPKPGGPTARTLLLQNMFTPTGVNLSKEPRFYEEIREDTQEECSKFGKVLHVTVDPRGAQGVIYVLYESPGQRQAAELALNGRWFEGKKILAAAIDDNIWQALATQAQG